MRHGSLLCLLLMMWTWLAPQTTVAEPDLQSLAAAPAGQKFSYGPDPLQFGELTLPHGSGPFPVIMNVHGGCWLAEYNIDHSRALANAFADAGIAVWNIEYRRVGNAGGGWPNTFLDVAAGADYLQTLARTQPLDLERVIAAGHSAGGHLALWLAARPRIATDSELYRDNPIGVSGVLALAPAPELDLLQEKNVCDNVVANLMDGAPATQPRRYDAAMPSRLAPVDVPKHILIGAVDTGWRWVGESYVRRARASGDQHIELAILPGAGHFEVIDPATTAWPRVLEAARLLLGVVPGQGISQETAQETAQ